MKKNWKKGKRKQEKIETNMMLMQVKIV